MIYTKETTPAQDAALEFIAKVRSERAPVPLTGQDMLVAIMDGALADLMAEASARVDSRRAALAKLASASDLAQVDAILAKYDPARVV